MNRKDKIKLGLVKGKSVKMELKEASEPTLKSYLGDRIFYDSYGQMIFSENESAGHQLILDVRGWGAIQHLFPMTEEGQKKASQFQDEFGEWVANTLNQKLKELK